MIIVNSKNSIPIRITKERWAHIAGQHPEMAEQKARIIETISDPDMIQLGDSGELIALRLYTQTPLSRKYLVAIYKEINDRDGFLITAYFTNSPLQRRHIVWKS